MLSPELRKQAGFQCRPQFLTGIGVLLLGTGAVFLIVCFVTGFYDAFVSYVFVFVLVGVISWFVGCMLSRQEERKNAEKDQEAPATGGQQPDARRQSSQHGRVSSDANRRTSASLESEGQSQSRTQQWAAPRRYTQPHEINALTPLSEEPDTPPSYESLGQQSAGQPPQRTGQGCDTQLRETSALSALSKGQGTPPSYDSLREHSVGETQPKTDPGVLPGAILSSALPEKPDGLPSYDSLGFARVTAEH